MKKSPKIMLIYPPVVTLTEENVPKNSQLPMGLAYIAAVLEKEGYNIKVLDAFTTEDVNASTCDTKKYYGLSPEGIRKDIENFQPDIVGISGMYTMYAKGTHLIANIVKNISKDILLVCGGTHASVNPRMVLEDENINIIVKGEGEITFLELIREFEKNKDLYRLEGIIYKKDGQLIENPSRPLIKNLDDLPFPARQHFPMQQYFENTINSRNFFMRYPYVSLITSRGCPGNCIYCCVERIWGRGWRSRTPDNVVDEIQSLIKNYGAREIHFTDDSISVDMRRLYKICQEIIKRKLDIRWTAPSGIAVWLLDKALLKIMKKSGCYRLTFGLESGNINTLRFIGKRYSYAKAKEIIREANRLGIWTAATFIIGFPQETKAQISETVSFAIKSGLDFLVFYTPIIFPGTPLFDVFMKEGIDYNPDMTGINRAYSTKHVTETELFKIRQDANYKFLFNRAMRFWRVINKVKNKEDFLYLIKLISNIMQNYISSAYDKKSAFGLLRVSGMTSKNTLT